MKQKIQSALPVIRHLSAENLFGVMKKNIYSRRHYYLLKLNLAHHKPYSLSRRPAGELCRMTADDFEAIRQQVCHTKGKDRKELAYRVYYYQLGFKQAYCVKADQKIAYLQWIIYPEDNEMLQKQFPGRYPAIHPSQVLLENAFTFPDNRGLGYYYYISSLLLEQVKREGYKFALSYVQTDNLDSLKSTLRMGFQITQIYQERRFLGSVRWNQVQVE